MKFENRTSLKKHINDEHELEPPDNTSDPKNKDNDEKVNLMTDSNAIEYDCHECGRFFSINQIKIQQCENNDTLKKHIKQEPPDDLSNLEYDAKIEHKLPRFPESNLVDKYITDDDENPEKEIKLKEEEKKGLDVEHELHVTCDITKEKNPFPDIEHEKIYRLCDDKHIKNKSDDSRDPPS